MGLYLYSTLQIEIIRQCNLDCKICMRQNLDGDGLSLSFDNFRRILRLNSGDFRYVGLHGWGEPLLNPEVFNMIEYAEKQGFYTNLTTNGTLVGGNIDKIFSSGLREIAVGVYHKENLPCILPQLKRFITERDKQGYSIPKIYMDITIYKKNLSQIINLVVLASEIGVDAVILHRLFNAYKVDLSIEYISEEEEEILFKEVKKMARELKMKLFLPQKHSLPCKAVRHCVFVTVEGKITPCCFLPQFYIGDALEENIKKSIYSKTYIDFVRTMNEHPVCSRCRW